MKFQEILHSLKNNLSEGKFLPSKNEGYGFIGEFSTIYNLDSQDKLVIDAWNEASKTVSKMFPEAKPADIRNFLDSANGRHLAEATAKFSYSYETQTHDYDKAVKALKDGNFDKAWMKSFNIGMKETLKNKHLF